MYASTVIRIQGFIPIQNLLNVFLEVQQNLYYNKTLKYDDST